MIRIYFNRDAADALATGTSAQVETSLRERGVEMSQLDLARYRTDRVKCDRLVAENDWKLFSLYPMMLSVQTLEACNARCSFCYASAPDTLNAEKMAPAEIYKLKDYAAENGVKFGISGGEPLLHPFVYDLLEYRADEVFETLISNFTARLDEDRFADTNVDLVQVSIHGQGQFHNDTLKIRDAYENVLARIRRLRPRINIATNTVITQDNIETIPGLLQDLVQVQEDTGKDLIYVRLVPVLPSGTGFSSYKTTEEFMAAVKSLLLDLRAEHGHEITFETPMLHPNPYEYQTDSDQWVCPAGSAVGVVRMDGAAVPCNQFLDTDLASHSTVWNGFHDVWTSDPGLTRMRAGVPLGPAAPSCEGCAYMTLKEREELSLRTDQKRKQRGQVAGVVQGLQIGAKV